MICYTLSDCVLKNLCTANSTNKKKYLTNLLFIFLQDNKPHKIAVDTQGKIIDIYASISDPDISYWLTKMGDNPSSWESIEVNNIEYINNNEDIFLMVCSKTDKMLIVYNHNGWTRQKGYHHKRNILYEDLSIRVLDRDEAIELLSSSEKEALNKIAEYEKDLQKPIVTINNSIKDSIVAQNGSSISDAKMEKK